MVIGTNVADGVAIDNQKLIKELEKIWADFLNGKAINWGDCEFHIAFQDYIDEKYLDNFPPLFTTYLFKLIDIFAYETETGKLGLVVKLPGVLLVCSIIPSKLKDMAHTKIDYLGTIYPDKIKDQNNLLFGLILIQRSLAVENEMASMSLKQLKLIEDEGIKNLLCKIP